MFKTKYAIIFFICCLQLSVFGQRDTVMVFIHQQNMSELTSFYHESTIIQTLETLHIPFFKDSLILDKVIYFNEINTNQAFLNQLAGELRRKEGFSGLSDEMRELNQKIGRALRSHQYFLSVGITQNSQHYQYHFKLFKTVKGENQKTLVYNDVLNPIRTSNATFEVKLNHTLQAEKISNAIKQCFPNSNIPPNARFSVVNKLYVQDSILRIGRGDTLILSADGSTDPNGDVDKLSYKWKQLGQGLSSKKSINNQLDAEKIQTVVFNQLGEFTIELTVTDGIADSKPVRIDLEVVPKRALLLQSAYKDNQEVILKQGNIVSSSIQYKRTFYLKPKHINLNSDTIYAEITRLEKFKNDGVQELQDTIVIDTIIFDNGTYKVKTLSTINPGVYAVDLFTRDISLTSNKERYLLEYRADQPTFVAAMVELQAFRYNDTTAFRSNAFQSYVRSFWYKNLGIEVGTGNVFNAYSAKIDLINIDKKSNSSFNAFSLLYKYKVPNAGFVNYAVTIKLGARKMLNNWDEESNTLSYRWVFGGGFDVSVPLFRKPAIALEFGGTLYRNLYKLVDASFLQRLNVGFGLGFSWNIALDRS